MKSRILNCNRRFCRHHYRVCRTRGNRQRRDDGG
jgi:hypothetical protein